MKHLDLITVVSVLLMLGVPLHAQVSENALEVQPAEQEQSPGLQQAPDGQTMKTVEKDRSAKESQTTLTGTENTSTGPTFPNDKSAK